ncbi:hypothetical protein WJ63_01585 [Burkholderia pyrrocinia]|nr:hypothetical protein WJ63_01585 [Burkholderia pyrrocinia]
MMNCLTYIPHDPERLGIYGKLAHQCHHCLGDVLILVYQHVFEMVSKLRDAMSRIPDLRCRLSYQVHKIDHS